MDRTQNDNALEEEASNNVTNTQAPKSPSEVYWQNIVAEGSIEKFNVAGNTIVTHFMKNSRRTTVETHHTSKVVGISQKPVGNNSQVCCPKEDENVIAPPTSTELVSKVLNCSIVDELEETDQGQDFSFKVISQQPPLGYINSGGVKHIADKPWLLEEHDKCANEEEPVNDNETNGGNQNLRSKDTSSWALSFKARISLRLRHSPGQQNSNTGIDSNPDGLRHGE